MIERFHDYIQLRDIHQAPVALPIYTWLVQQVVFHLTGLLFEYLDASNKLASSKVRHIRSHDRRKTYVRLLPRVLINQTVVLLPCMVVSQQVLGWCFVGDRESWRWWRYLISLPAMALGHDLVQYATHRFVLHQPNLFLMRLFKHSIHHSTGASRGISACYMSSLDFLLEIVLPYLLPLAVIGGGSTNSYYHCLIAGMGAIGGIYEHSGYDFSIHFEDTQSPGSLTRRLRIPAVLADWLRDFLDNRSHGEHHTRANVSFSDGFGSTSVSDAWFKTRWFEVQDSKTKRRSRQEYPYKGAKFTRAEKAIVEEEKEMERVNLIEEEWQRQRVSLGLKRIVEEEEEEEEILPHIDSPSLSSGSSTLSNSSDDEDHHVHSPADRPASAPKAGPGLFLRPRSKSSSNLLNLAPSCLPFPFPRFNSTSNSPTSTLSCPNSSANASANLDFNLDFNLNSNSSSLDSTTLSSSSSPSLSSPPLIKRRNRSSTASSVSSTSIGNITADLLTSAVLQVAGQQNQSQQNQTQVKPKLDGGYRSTVQVAAVA